ncbi:hypothetical protein ACFOZ5_11895 [Marinobacter lacisalsi]|uniref:Integral membrane protein n=1 Tax=Marinobacter lacisalsi TaxID=475979 RepID=A0ABV8QHD0_9GAMM
MKYDHLPMPAPGVLLDFGAVSVWLLLLMATNLYNTQPVTVLIPYLAPVIYISWRYGALLGIAVATFATFAAAPGGYVASHDAGQVFWAVFYTYSQITSGVVGTAFARWLHRQKLNR